MLLRRPSGYDGADDAPRPTKRYIDGSTTIRAGPRGGCGVLRKGRLEFRKFHHSSGEALRDLEWAKEYACEGDSILVDEWARIGARGDPGPLLFATARCCEDAPTSQGPGERSYRAPSSYPRSCRAYRRRAQNRKWGTLYRSRSIYEK